MPEEKDEGLAKELFREISGKAKDCFNSEYYRSKTSLPGESPHLHTTLEDFKRMKPDMKRIIVIGATGAGKSTLLNTLGGWKLQMNKEDASLAWNHPTLFEASFECDSVTKKTAFANLNWLGDEKRKFIVVDTPGIDDSDSADIDDKQSREHLAELAADLHNKLQAMKHVNAVLILHNDVHGNRLNPLTYTMLKMVSEKFAEAGSELWKSVIVAYSKCNDHDYSWRANLEQKKKKLQESIKQKIPSCTVDIPVIALGGVDLIDKNNASADLPKTSPAFEELWQFLQSAAPLPTTELKVFEGEYAKFEKIIKDKEAAEARLDARKDFITVIVKILVVKFVLLMRSLLIPNLLSIFVLNDSGGIWDEVLILLVVCYCIGLMKVWLALKIVYEDYIEPYAGPHLEPVIKQIKESLSGSKGGDDKGANKEKGAKKKD